MKTARIMSKMGVLFAAAALIGACSTSPDASTTEKENISVTYVEEVGGEKEKYVASLSIDGMACEMSCGSAISSALSGIEGVANTDIEFNGAEEENFAVVEFDSSITGEKEMIEVVEKLANGHYTVNKVKVTHFKVAESDNVPKSDKPIGSIHPKLDYDLPNFFSVFARLF